MLELFRKKKGEPIILNWITCLGFRYLTVLCDWNISSSFTSLGTPLMNFIEMLGKWHNLWKNSLLSLYRNSNIRTVIQFQTGNMSRVHPWWRAEGSVPVSPIPTTPYISLVARGTRALSASLLQQLTVSRYWGITCKACRPWRWPHKTCDTFPASWH